jgi:hypothetical protein
MPVGLTKEIITSKFKKKSSPNLLQWRNHETNTTFLASCCCCEWWPRGCTWCSKLNIDGRYDEVLTGSNCNYIALRLVTMIIRIEIRVLGEDTPGSLPTVLHESHTKRATKLTMSCIYIIVLLCNQSKWIHVVFLLKQRDECRDLHKAR